MRRPVFRFYYLALWCAACAVLPFLKGRELAHPEILPWLAAGGLGLLGVLGLTGGLLRGSAILVPRGWFLCLALACLSAVAPLCFRTTSLEPSLLWCLGLVLGFQAFRSWGRGVSLPWLGVGCLLSSWSILRWIDPSFLGSFVPHGNPNLLGAAVAAAVPQALSVSEQKRVLRVLLCLFLVAGVFCSGSLGAFVALGMGLLYRGTGSKRGFLAVFLALWCAALALLPGLKRWTVLKPVYDSTIGIRLYIWEGSAAAFLESPWVGWGPTRFQWVYPQYRVPSYFSNPRATTGTRHAHGELLERAVEEGLLGAIPFLLLLGLLFAKRLFHPDRRAFQVSAAILLLHGWMDITLRAPGTTFLFALAAGAASNRIALSRRRSVPLGLLCLGLVAVEAGRQRSLVQASHALWEARTAVREGDGERALARANQGLLAMPHDLDLLLEQGFVLAGLGLYEEAEQSYRKALTVSPFFADARSSLAKMLLMRGKERQALPHLEAASKDNPWDADTLWNLALVRFRLGKTRKAGTALERLLDLDPDHEQALSLLRGAGGAEKKGAESLGPSAP